MYSGLVLATLGVQVAIETQQFDDVKVIYDFFFDFYLFFWIAKIVFLAGLCPFS